MRDQLNKGEHLSTPLKQKKKSFFQGGETKSMKMKKFMASFLAFAMLLSLVAIPVGTADAATTYNVVSVPQIGESAVGTVGVIQVKVDPFLEESHATIKFPTGVNITAIDTLSATTGVDVTFGAKTAQSSTATAFAGSQNEVRIFVKPNGGSAIGEEVIINLQVKVNPADKTGDLVATITGLSGQLQSSSLTVATVGDGIVTVAAGKANNISGNGNSITLTLTESSTNALAQDNESLKFRLPSGYEWAVTGSPSAGFYNADLAGLTVFIGGTAGNFAALVDEDDRRDLIIDKNVATTPGQKQVLEIKPKINVTRDASYGDVIMTISGESDTNVSELTVAKYADYGVKFTAEEAKKVVAGTEGKKVSTLIIEESAPGSLIAGRTAYLTLPTGAKWNQASVTAVGSAANKGVTATLGSVTDSGKTLAVTFSGNGTGAAKIEIKDLKIDTAIDFVGDVAVVASGNAGVEGTVTVAEVTAPFTVTAEKKNVVLAKQNQETGNIVITEAKAESFKKGNIIEISYDVPGVRITSEPKATVTAGDIKVDVDLVSNTNIIKLTVTSVSSKASTIELSGIIATVDRYAPEGDLALNVDAPAIAANNELNATGQTGKAFEDKVTFATVVNAAVGSDLPADAQVKFVIDAKTYNVDGVEKTMDVAPFIQDGRTMLPVRFVAEALGVSEDNILWNANTKQVTIMKGDRIAQLTIGSDAMLVNGVSMTMDTKAAIKDGRTVLPVRFVAQALNANIAWDEATRTVTVN